MAHNTPVALAALALALCSGALARTVQLEAPAEAQRYDVAEFVLRVAQPVAKNPFTDVVLHGEFSLPGEQAISVQGFCDSPEGTVFRLRFCPEAAPATYRYRISFRDPAGEERFSGELRALPGPLPGPVVVNPEHRKHFIYKGTAKTFYHLGFTAYHLLDPSNDEAQIRATIDYCAEHGFNKIRFLLAGYPRDTDRRPRSAQRPGKPGDWKAPNYGAPPGEVNPLPAWLGRPHAYDFTRFDVEHWRRAERAVRYMRDRGIVATCIFTIEKQRLPQEYGKLSEAEYRFYAYAIARLAAFCNVWWDLGNEHNEYRDKAWGDTMGAFVKQCDPYDRLASAHAYADFWYSNSPWADFIITQQYGTEQEVNAWALKYWSVPKPYVNEEYGYEGAADKPGHGQNADWVRRCHWSIALAGGYATYGDWHDAAFYIGEPGPGKAPRQLKLLRQFFEALPVAEMVPRNELIEGGFCLARPGELYVFYLPRGGQAKLSLPQRPALSARWFNPRTGQWLDRPGTLSGIVAPSAPDERDWVLLARVAQ